MGPCRLVRKDDSSPIRFCSPVSRSRHSLSVFAAAAFLLVLVPVLFGSNNDSRLIPFPSLSYSYCSAFTPSLIPSAFSTSSFSPPRDFLTRQKRTQQQPSSSPLTTTTTTTSTTAIMGIKGFRSWFESQFPDAIAGMAKEGAQEDFDHVLIDMNQLLHVVLRKSRTEGHCFALLLQELDACVKMATPQQSLVLAMDGPPGAAKLATQRRRRFQTVTKTQLKVQQLDKLLASVKNNNNNNGNTSSNNSSKRSKTRIKQWTHKKRKAVAEIRTLCITPATEFMELAEQAILYWAWQRLSARHTDLSTNNVKIFISPSTVPGEGEVKLLEWIYTKQRRGESVAILGGDSDLVLEALVIPVASTHNVFVLLPDGNKRYLSVSLWETTRTLGRYLPHNMCGTSIETAIAVRTDLVLLLILNGNDYLPKLRGSSGFNKTFHSYLRLQRAWHNAAAAAAAGKEQQRAAACLVDPDTLQFNLDFAIAFFGRLAAMAPANVLWLSKDKKAAAAAAAGTTSTANRNTPLQQLNNMMDGGFIPAPMKFMVIRDDGDDDDDREEVNANDDDVEEKAYENNSSREDSEDDDDEEEADSEEEADVDQILVRLLLGEPGSEDFFAYEIWYPRGQSLKTARHKLAAMALADLMDEQNSDAEEEDDDAEDEDGIGITSTGYEWEIRHNVEGKVEPYLYGLLWNLQTYQDGVCADYSYNYGKRLSPLAKEITAFFELALAENRTVGPKDLRSAPFSPPVSAGLSCLAALPSPVKHLVPEPYRSLADDTVEAFYASCMDPEDNVFDIKRFERLCEEEIRSMQLLLNEDDDSEERKKLSEPHDGRRIVMGDHYWTVISKVPKALPHPFDPPKPFSDRLSKLKPNNKIRVSRFMATAAPRPRSVWDEDESPSHAKKKDGFVNKDVYGFSHSDPGDFLGKLKTIEKVDYRVAYQKNKKKERKGLRKGKITLTLQLKDDKMATIKNDKETKNGVAKAGAMPDTEKKTKPDAEKVTEPTSFADVQSRMKHFNIQPPPSQPIKNLDGDTAMAVLKQLSDLELIGPIQWDSLTPSTSRYASFDPRNHELVRLSVSKGLNPKTIVLRENLTYEQDRDMNTVARKVIQQHLASFALCDITGPAARWSELSYKDLTKFLTNAKVEG